MQAEILSSPIGHTGVGEVPSDDINLIRHYTIPPDEEAIIRRKLGRENMLGLAVHLALLKHPGRLWRLGELPPPVLVRHLAVQLKMSATALRDYAPTKGNHSRYAAEAMAFLGMRSFQNSDVATMESVAADAARDTDKIPLIVAAIVNRLRTCKIALPVERTLERAAHTGRATAETRAVEAILSHVTPEQERQLLDLVRMSSDVGATPLGWLREVAEAPSPDNLEAVKARLDYMRRIGLDTDSLKSVSPWRFRQLAREGAKVKSSDLARYNQRKLLAILAAQIGSLTTTLSDGGVDMFCKLIASRFSRAVSRQKDEVQSTQKESGTIARRFSGLVATIDDAMQAGVDVGHAINNQHDMDELRRLKPVADDIANLSERDTLVVAAEGYGHIRQYAPLFLDMFAFTASNAGSPIMKAIAMMREVNQTNRRVLPDDAPISFLSNAWQDLVVVDGRIDRHRYETALMATIRDRLRSGDLSVVGSTAYQPFDTLMVSSETAKEYACTLPFEAEAQTFVAAYRHGLDQRMRDVFLRLRRGELEGVSYSNGAISISPVEGLSTRDLEAAAAEVGSAMPTFRITELFQRVHNDTHVFDAFTNANGKEHYDTNTVMAAVWATASNIPLEKMALSSPGITVDQLVWAQQHYLSEENFEAATARLIDHQRGLPMARAWGDGSVSSSDGQFVPTGRKVNGTGDVNSKYSREPGIKIYSHTTDQNAPLYARGIAASASEVPHVLDGLWLHGSGTLIVEHHTDTGGASDLVFALGMLMGVRIMPRYRDFHKLKFGIMRSAKAYPEVAPILGNPINETLVFEHWPDVIRLAVSLHQRTLAPSQILRQITVRNQQNQFGRALHELGRMIRSDAMLTWISEPEVRRSNQVMLNKGEMSHVLSDAIRMHRQGRIMDRSSEQQGLRVKAGQFVKAMVVVSNTTDLDAVVDRLRTNGRSVPDELLTHISPLATRHIAFNGDYLWEKAWNKMMRKQHTRTPSTRH